MTLLPTGSEPAYLLGVTHNHIHFLCEEEVAPTHVYVQKSTRAFTPPHTHPRSHRWGERTTLSLTSWSQRPTITIQTTSSPSVMRWGLAALEMRVSYQFACLHLPSLHPLTLPRNPVQFSHAVLQFFARRRATSPLGHAESLVLAEGRGDERGLGGNLLTYGLCSGLSCALQAAVGDGSLEVGDKDVVMTGMHLQNSQKSGAPPAAEVVSHLTDVLRTPPSPTPARPAHAVLKAENLRRLAASPLLLSLPDFGT
jgi:hypothetical protein